MRACVCAASAMDGHRCGRCRVGFWGRGGRLGGAKGGLQAQSLNLLLSSRDQPKNPYA